LRKRFRYVGIHETVKSLVIICSQLGKVKDRHSALARIFSITQSDIETACSKNGENG
jgi:hypothetical protein